jgi:autotransporter-associated beta strand protein
MLDTCFRAKPDQSISPLCLCGRLACTLIVTTAMLTFAHLAPAYDSHFDYTSFSSTFVQSQFDVLNYPSMNGNFMMTSSDTHRPEMVANGNDLAEFYNNFLADYNKSPRPTATEEADAINAYTIRYSTTNGPKPSWLILNEISSSLWQQNPGDPSLSTHRTWVIDTVTRLNDVYGYKVITYSPYQQLMTTANSPSWQALAAKSYIAIEAYLSGPEVMGGGTDYASRVAYAQSKYLAAKNSYLADGLDASRLFVSEHFANNAAVDSNGNTVTWGRAGLASASDWDQVIMEREDAMKNVGFAGFLAYSWGGNGMGVTQAEQIEHEYYYRSRLVLPGQKPQWLSDSAINVNGTTIPLSWNQPLNWIGGVPNTPGAEANFWRTLTANRSITLDGSKTVGKLTFDSSFTYTITPGTGGSLVFNNSGGAANLTSNQGSHTIATDVQLATDLNAAINSGIFTISGHVSGSGGLFKSGAGALSLTATGSYAGNTTVQAGKLAITYRGLTDTADVLLSNGATLALNFTGSPDVIDSLFLNGISQPVGTWGAIGSGAEFTSSLLAGPGLLQIATYVPSPLVGDYNSNGVVDAADYVVWRRSVGATSIPNRNPANSGPVGQADFDFWRGHLGQIVGSGSGSGVSATTTALPEPATMPLMLIVGMLAMCSRRQTLNGRIREVA